MSTAVPRRSTQRTGRVRLLVLSHPDGHVEVYGPEHVDIHIERVPAAFSVEAERLAVELAEAAMPSLYRDQYRADRLRATGTTRPLLPSTLRDVKVVRELLDTCNRIEKMADPVEGAGNAAAKKLLRERKAAE